MWRLGAAVLVLVALPACDRSAGNSGETKPLETVDVDGGFDAGLTTDFDERAKPVEIDMGGVLPSDFPQEMPVFSPSSIIDFGPGFVEVDTPVPVTEVQTSLGVQIRRAGWAVDSIGDGGSVYTRGAYRVRVLVRDAGTGTRIRYEY
jgi:hypothetical protein